MAKKRKYKVNDIQPGMEVEAAKGDLGEKDFSKPKVKEAVRGQNGEVEEVIIQKGIIFRKELEIPAERVQKVKDGKAGDSKEVVIDSTEEELEALKAGGREKLQPGDNEGLIDEDEDDNEDDSLLDKVEENIPTVESLREMETDSTAHVQDQEQVKEQEKPVSLHGITPWLRLLGPGFLAGMAGNDASAVAAYAIDGAQNGFAHLWLMLLSTPMYQSVQYTCAKLGRITQKGLAEVLHEHYGMGVAVLAALVLLIANIVLITADLVAIGSGLELMTHISWIWFIVPVAVIVWYFTVFRTFETIKKVFTVMSLAFVAYIITAIIARPDWEAILFNTFVPHMDFSFISISSVVALLGATISPYSIFWQVQGEKEEKRPGTKRQQIHFAAFDIGAGVVSGNLIAYFIIVSTATTLFTHHKSISSASDAAQALIPILGPFGEYLFALGLVGAGLVAIPVLLASTSYAVAGSIGWPVGLSKKPWQNEGFYLILTVALLISLVMALIHLDPIKLLFYANVLSGVLAPILVVYLIVMGNSRKIMRNERLSWITNLGLIVTATVMIAAAGLLFYGLATGQSR